MGNNYNRQFIKICRRNLLRIILKYILKLMLKAGMCKDNPNKNSGARKLLKMQG